MPGSPYGIPSGLDATHFKSFVADLQDAESAWQFLLAQELVSASDTGAQQLRAAVEVESARGRITGGSLALRVGEHLLDAGLTLAAAKRSDPSGKLAAKRWDSFKSSGDARAV